MVIAPTITIGQAPNSIIITPDGNYAYITNFTSGTVSVVTV